MNGPYRIGTGEQPGIQHGMIALFVMVATALLPGSVWGRSDGAVRFAAPAAQEETIYWPECPTDEVASGWLSCRGVRKDDG